MHIQRLERQKSFCINDCNTDSLWATRKRDEKQNVMISCRQYKQNKFGPSPIKNVFLIFTSPKMSRMTVTCEKRHSTKVLLQSSSAVGNVHVLPKQ